MIMVDYRTEAPEILRDFLAYHETVKAHSRRTVDEYFLDLRNFFRYMKQIRDPALSGKPLDEIDIIYTEYQNGKPAQCQRNCLLPLERSQLCPTLDEPPQTGKEFFPDPDTVLEGIIPSYLTGFIYSCLVDSYCSEQEARMTAMSSAGKNAEEILKKLQMQYNSLRQAAITREMVEITSGAKALKRKREKNQSGGQTF